MRLPLKKPTCEVSTARMACGKPGCRVNAATASREASPPSRISGGSVASGGLWTSIAISVYGTPAWRSGPQILTKQARKPIEQGRDDGRRRDGDDPREHDVIGHVPAHRRHLAGSADADDGARDGMRG